MEKKVAILQSNYIPWKGYFDLINAVDEFILYDEMQYTKNDWRNRNKIKTAQGVQWLTIPAKQENLAQTIRETKVASDIWRSKHWKTITLVYGRCKCFSQYRQLFEGIYLDSNEPTLSKINHAFIMAVNRILGINTKLTWSSDYQLVGDRNARLVNLCKQAGADIYLTGPSALAYMDSDMFAREKISVEVADYSGYLEYFQLYPPFEHAVSIIDLIFNMGSEARKFMKSFPESARSRPFLVRLPDWQPATAVK
ncbi:MAG: WbqC family protein [Gammaproteobacteria bacterium]